MYRFSRAQVEKREKGGGGEAAQYTETQALFDNIHGTIRERRKKNKCTNRLAAKLSFYAQIANSHTTLGSREKSVRSSV